MSDEPERLSTALFNEVYKVTQPSMKAFLMNAGERAAQMEHIIEDLQTTLTRALGIIGTLELKFVECQKVLKGDDDD